MPPISNDWAKALSPEYKKEYYILKNSLKMLDKLKLENSKLTDEINHEKDMRIGENQYAKTIIDDLKKNIKKLKKIINILEDKLEIFIDKTEYGIPFVKCWLQSCGLENEEYELLKEVLEND